MATIHESLCRACACPGPFPLPLPPPPPNNLHSPPESLPPPPPYCLRKLFALPTTSPTSRSGHILLAWLEFVPSPSA